MHIANNLNLLHTYLPLPPNMTHSVITAGGTLSVFGYGTAHICDGSSNSLVLTLTNVMYAPTCPVNLLSIAKLNEAGGVYLSTSTFASITTPGGQSIKTTRCHNGCFLFKSNNPTAFSTLSLPSPPVNPAMTTHLRLGHVSFSTLARMAKNGAVSNLGCTIEDINRAETCMGCVTGKYTRSPFPSQPKPKAVLELICSDLCGPLPLSLNGERFLAVVRDVHSGYTMASALRRKNEVGTLIRYCVERLENITGKKVLQLRTDRGGEFLSDELSTYLLNKGIMHGATAAFSSASNGTAERANRTIMDKVRATLEITGQPRTLWPFAVGHVVHALNRTCMRGSDSTPYEMMFGQKPDLGHLRPFGAACITWIPMARRSDKLEPHGVPARLVDYVNESTSMYKASIYMTGCHGWSLIAPWETCFT